MGYFSSMQLPLVELRTCELNKRLENIVRAFVLDILANHTLKSRSEESRVRSLGTDPGKPSS